MPYLDNYMLWGFFLIQIHFLDLEMGTMVFLTVCTSSQL